MSYEVLRHLVRLTEEDMIEALAEVVCLGLVRRAVAPVRYEIAPAVAGQVRRALGEERLEALARRVAAARERVHEG